MKIEVKVPVVGESITEVTIAQWLKQDGDTVEMDEVICELESDKATFELNAEKAGTLSIVAGEGDTLEVGQLVCYIDAEGAAEHPAEDESQAAAEEPAKPAEGKAVEMRVPEVGESITEVTLGAWLKEEGDVVEFEEIIAEIESDKATFELPADVSGKLERVAGEGETLEIGALICRILPAAGRDSHKTAVQKDVSDVAKADKVDSHATGHPSPAAAKILSEKGISPGELSGTGVGGRITKEDAMKAQKPVPSANLPKAVAYQERTTDKPVAPVSSAERPEERKRMSNLRKTVARRLVNVKNETAMLTTFNEVDMKPVMDLRKLYKESFKEKYEVNLGFMSFFTKACTIALQEWPAVNAQIDGDEIVYSKFCDISIAVSAPKGLVVPVIRNAEKLSFQEIEKEVVRLAGKARENKLSIPEMTGGTFTITNGGIFGSMLSTPIINAPQSAILGMHNIVERPVAVNGQVEIRPIMYVALSYDHRIIDGRESVSFLKRVKELLEDPARMLLGV
ncbi:MAG: 2-oxoglutarate dehydrogenase complex dihydrolipoyllysine-residue succinyltransferase [Cytophagales bacterium]|nr:2-oxoglutarate dehydrogenase complex dihydrolipoyllysine-residue succinyltransferase [Cytophagales bacterium]